MNTLRKLSTLICSLLVVTASAAAAQAPAALLVVESVGTASITFGPAPPVEFDFRSAQVLYRDGSLHNTTFTDAAIGTLAARGRASEGAFADLTAALRSGRIGLQSGECSVEVDGEGEVGIDSLQVTWFGRNERRSHLRLVTVEPGTATSPACTAAQLALVEAIFDYVESVDNLQGVSTGAP